MIEVWDVTLPELTGEKKRRAYVYLPQAAESDAELLMGTRIDIDRNSAAEDHRIDDTSVDISRNDDLFASGRDGKYHRLNRRSRTAYHKESGSCSECLRREFLGFLDDGDRVAEIVQGLHGIDVEHHGALA